MDTPPKTPSYARTALAVALLAVLYLWVFPYHTAVNNPNENVRVFMTVAIVDDHTFAINRVERDWGYVNDKSLRETPLSEAITQRHVSDDVLRAAGVTDDVLDRFHHGRATAEDRARRVNLLYSSKAPGTSYLGVPAYWLLTRLTHRDTHLPPPAPAVAPGHRAPTTREPIERLKVVYFVRLFANVLPGLVFAWFWYRFLARRTQSPALADAVFYSTMAGSSLYAYNEVFASHAHNAMCLAAAIMALCAARERDADALAAGRDPNTNAGLFFLAGLFGTGITLFEYPAGIATAVIGVWIAAMNAERRRAALAVSFAALVAGAVAFEKTQKKSVAAVAALVALAGYGATLRGRNVARLAAAGVGGAIPVALLMLYHKRCFGDVFKPGYSYLENQQFRTEISQGFFGATDFSWEAGLRLWFDPAFGLVPSTFVLAVALLGVGAFLAWRPEPRGVRIAVRAMALALLTFTLVKLGLAIKAHSGALTHADVGRAVVATTLAALANMSVWMPPSPRREAPLGLVVLASSFGMTLLIGMMNNWRGGWQVGPRYLVTLVPVLAIAALAALDALHRAFEDRPAAQRAVTLFASGATVAAFIVTGLPSATFPHIPTEFNAPLFEMVLPVLRDGFVPHNAGRYLFDLQGPTSMFGFVAAAALMLALVLRGDERRPLAAMAHTFGAIAFAVVMLSPFAIAARPETSPVMRYVKSAWEPRPADAPAVAAAPPRNETPEQSAARARRLAEAGDTVAAMDAWLRSIHGTLPRR